LTLLKKIHDKITRSKAYTFSLKSKRVSRQNKISTTPLINNGFLETELRKTANRALHLPAAIQRWAESRGRALISGLQLSTFRICCFHPCKLTDPCSDDLKFHINYSKLTPRSGILSQKIARACTIRTQLRNKMDLNIPLRGVLLFGQQKSEGGSKERIAAIFRFEDQAKQETIRQTESLFLAGGK
jgi:hypothetical protein